MALTPRQTEIHELMVKREEALLQLKVLRIEHERHGPIEDPDARKQHNAAYAAAMREVESRLRPIDEKLAGDMGLDSDDPPDPEAYPADTEPEGPNIRPDAGDNGDDAGEPIPDRSPTAQDLEDPNPAEPPPEAP